MRSDLEVAHFLCVRSSYNSPRGTLTEYDYSDSVGGYRYKERRDRLLDILFVFLLLAFDGCPGLRCLPSDVDLAWHMHEVSDGERRRVQIVSGLMAPWDLLLLDEVRVDDSAHCSGSRASARSELLGEDEQH